MPPKHNEYKKANICSDELISHIAYLKIRLIKPPFCSSAVYITALIFPFASKSPVSVLKLVICNENPLIASLPLTVLRIIVSSSKLIQSLTPLKLIFFLCSIIILLLLITFSCKTKHPLKNIFKRCFKYYTIRYIEAASSLRTVSVTSVTSTLTSRVPKDISIISPTFTS